ncbi:uncharacterized protein LOC141900394 isoform X2 [Tubulanus polymorphus]
MKRYGVIFRYYFFRGMPRVLVSDPDIMKYIMVTNQKNFEKSTEIGLLSFVLRNGLVTSNGDVHRQHRKLANPAFTIKSIKKMMPIFKKKSVELVDLWTSKMDKKIDGDKCIVPVFEDLMRMTLDVIGLCAFSYNFDCLHDPDNEINKHFQGVIGGIYPSWEMLLPYYQYIPFLPNMSRMRHHLKAADEVVLSVIHERMEKISTDGGNIDYDLLGMLMMAKDEETGQGMTSEELRDEVLTFLLAGHETTSVGVTWVLYHLADHIHIQNHLRDEIHNVLMQENTNDLSYETFEKMPYLDAVINETLRFTPPVVMVVRKSKDHDVLGGYEVPAGTNILLATGAMMRNEQFWDDPDTFDPDRFYRKEVDSSKFLPFVAGPRMCIGYKFALLEMKMIVARALRSFRFTKIPGSNYTKKIRVTMRPDPPLELYIKAV